MAQPLPMKGRSVPQLPMRMVLHVSAILAVGCAGAAFAFGWFPVVVVLGSAGTGALVLEPGTRWLAKRFAGWGWPYAIAMVVAVSVPITIAAVVSHVANQSLRTTEVIIAVGLGFFAFEAVPLVILPSVRELIGKRAAAR
jgi:hypothetical protein